MLSKKTMTYFISVLHNDLLMSDFHFQVFHSFPFKEQGSFNFTAAVTIRNDFRTQENRICHCFHFSPFFLS